MFILPNRDPAILQPRDEEILEEVVGRITSELKESVIAQGLKSIEYTTYHDGDDRRVMFVFHAVGKPQAPMAEFERVLAMRFTQILWEGFGKRCLPVGFAPEDDKFRPWTDGEPDYLLGREDKPRSGAPDALPEGLAGDDDRPKRAR